MSRSLSHVLSGSGAARAVLHYPVVKSTLCTAHCRSRTASSVVASYAKGGVRSSSSSSTTNTTDEEKEEKNLDGDAHRDKKKMLNAIEAENERIRMLLLERDGGPASVPTRDGKWDSDMGRETSRQMHRVLDQTRVARPGQNHAMGEGESKHFNWRNR